MAFYYIVWLKAVNQVSLFWVEISLTTEKMISYCDTSAA